MNAQKLLEERMSKRIRALVLMGATWVAALMGTGQVQAQNTGQGEIMVQNNRNVAVTVLVEQGNFDMRIGTVPAASTATLVLPARLLYEGATLNVFVHPEGGLDLAAQAFDVRPGIRLGLIVPEAGHHYVLSAEAPSNMVEKLKPEEQDAVTVTVENPRSVDVTVYVEQGPFDLRLGTVRANETRTFRLPEWLARDQDTVEFTLHPAHGAELSSGTMTLHPNAHLGIKVPAR